MEPGWAHGMQLGEKGHLSLNRAGTDGCLHGNRCIHFQQIKGLDVTGHLELSGELRAAEDVLARSTDLYRIVN